MRITTRLVLQMTDDPEVYLELERESYEYEGPVEECKPQKPPAEGQALKLSQQEMAGRDKSLGAANEDISGIEGDLGYYSGKPEDSPLYKANINLGTSGITQAYNNAVAGTRARANSAGFGYSQPVAQGATDEVEGERASALAKLPNEALMKTSDQQLKASGLRAGLANMRQSQAGYYNPSGYFNTYAGLQNSRYSRPSGWGKALGVAGQLAGDAAGFFSPAPA